MVDVCTGEFRFCLSDAPSWRRLAGNGGHDLEIRLHGTQIRQRLLGDNAAGSVAKTKRLLTFTTAP